MAERQLNLPTFNATTTDPGQIYVEGLTQIAPHEMMLSEDENLRSNELVDLLQKSAAEVQAMGQDELVKICGSGLAAAVVLARAQEGASCKDERLAKALSRRVTVLTCMMNLLNVPGNVVFRRMTVATKTGLSEESGLLRLWATNYFHKVRGDQLKLDRLKILCHAIVWALHCTPQLTFDASLAWEKNEFGKDLEKAKQAFRYVGCNVEGKFLVKLRAPLKIISGQSRGPRKRKRM